MHRVVVSAIEAYLRDAPTTPRYLRGLADTSVIVDFDLLATEDLPAEPAVSAVTLAELTRDAHLSANPARRRRLLRRASQAEAAYDVLSFDAEAARQYGVLTVAGASARGHGLLVAAVAAANRLPLFTAEPHAYRGLGDLVMVIAVRRRTVGGR